MTKASIVFFEGKVYDDSDNWMHVRELPDRSYVLRNGEQWYMVQDCRAVAMPRVVVPKELQALALLVS